MGPVQGLRQALQLPFRQRGAGPGIGIVHRPDDAPLEALWEMATCDSLLVHVASVDERQVTKRVPNRLVNAFAAVDDEQQGSVAGQASVDEVTEQRVGQRCVLRAAFQSDLARGRPTALRLSAHRFNRLCNIPFECGDACNS